MYLHLPLSPLPNYSVDGSLFPYSSSLSLHREGKDLVYKDAIYFSPHKFVGGVESPGMEGIRVVTNCGYSYNRRGPGGEEGSVQLGPDPPPLWRGHCVFRDPLNSPLPQGSGAEGGGRDPVHSGCGEGGAGHATEASCGE